MEANFMNCSGRSFLTRVAYLTSVGALLAAGCGGSGTKKPDAGLEAGALPATLMIDKTMADLGSVVVGQAAMTPATFTIRNIGSTTSGTPNVVVSGEGFSVASMTCGMGSAGVAAAGSCTVAVTFRPGSEGNKTGMLSVSATPGGTQTATLSGVGLKAGDLTSSSNRVEFPATAVGATSGGEIVTIRNTGGTPITNLMVAVGDTMNFGLTSTCMATLAGGANCVATVTFTPKTRGPKTSALTITGGTQSIPVALAGTGQAPAALVIQPTAPTVAGTVSADSAPIHFIVGNSGDIATGVPAASLTGTNMADFTISSNGCVTPIAPLTTCSIDVVFKAAMAGTRTANLVVTATPGGMVTAPITGTAVIGGTLEVLPNPLDLGMVSVGTASATKALTVKNAGGSATGAISVSLAAGEFTKGTDTCSGVVLAPNATCTIDIGITATSMGAKTGVIVISGGAAGQAVANLTANASQGPTFSLSTAALAFGNAPIGTTSGAQMITVTNTGSAATGVPSVALGGAAPNEFMIAGNSCTAALAPAGTCSISIVFKPTIIQASNATVTVSGTPGVSGVASLSGSGTAIGTLAVFPSANPAAGLQDFGAMVVNGQTDPPISFTVKNNGMAASGTVAVAIAGANNTSFTIVSNGCMDQNLAAGASCVVTVRFTPKSVGSLLTATLTATAMGTTGSVVLNGQGLNPIDVYPNVQGDVSPFDHLKASVSMASATTKTHWVFVRGNLGTVTTAVTAGSSDFAITAGDCNNTAPASVGNALPLYTLNGAAVTGGNPAVTSGGLFANDTGAPSNPVAVCFFTTTFTPGARGVRTGTVTVSATGGGSATVALTGEGVGPLTITPSVYAFTDTAVGAVQSNGFVVKNNAATNATAVTITLSGANTGDFQITNNPCTTTIAAGAMCTVTVQFQPGATGAKAVTLNVNGTIAAASESQTAAITGNAVGAPGITIAAVAGSSATFPTTAIGNTSAVQTFVVTNTGSTSTSAIDLALFQNTNAGTGDYTLVSGCGAALVPGGTCQATVTFAPQAGKTGTRTALLRGVGSPGGTATLSLSGTATANIDITTDADGGPAVTSLDFGVIPVSTASAPAPYIRIYNRGTATIAAGALTFAYQGAGDYPQAAATAFQTFDDQCAVTAVPTGMFCRLGLRAASNATAGVYTGRLKITGASTKVVGVVDLKVVVGANTTQAGVDIVDFANNANISLGQTFVGQPGPTSRTLTVRNTGGAAANITVTWDGLAPVPTSLVTTAPTTCATGMSLGAGATCTISVQLANAATAAVASVLKVCVPGSGTTTFCEQVNITGNSDIDSAAAVAGTRGIYSANSVGIFGSFDITAVAVAETKTYTIRNYTAADITLAGAPVFGGAGFTENAAGTCDAAFVLMAAGANSCTLMVDFDPAAIGLNLGTVTLTNAGNTRNMVMPLVGTGTEDTGVTLLITSSNPSVGNFGDVLAGTAGKSLPFTITNIGTVTTTAAVVPAVTNTTHYSVTGCNATLPAGSSCVATVTFAPTVGAVVSGAGNVDLTSVLSATAGAATSNNFNLTGRAVVDALVTLTAGTSLAFPNQYTYSNAPTAAQNITVQNGSLGTDTLANRKRTGPLNVVSSDPTNIYININGCDDEQTFGVDPAVGNACTLTAVYVPQVQDAALSGAKVTVSATPGGSVDAAVSGNSIGALQFNTAGATTARITTHDFGNQAITTTSAVRTFTVENKVAGPGAGFTTGAISFTLDGAAGVFAPATPATCVAGSDLAAGQVCTFSVTFTPATTGVKAGTLKVSGAPGFSQTITLAGTGI
jgi:hypothetical protein